MNVSVEIITGIVVGLGVIVNNMITAHVAQKVSLLREELKVKTEELKVKTEELRLALIKIRSRHLRRR